MTPEQIALMRVRKDLPQPLFRQDFSDWMFKQYRWSLNFQDSMLSWLTTPLYEALTTGELGEGSFDPYLALEKALFRPKNVSEAREILKRVEVLLDKAIKEAEPQTNYWKVLKNWRAAWNVYSEYMESEWIQKI